MNRRSFIVGAAISALALVPGVVRARDVAPRANALPAEIATALEKAERIEVFALNPRSEEAREGGKSPEMLHGYRILARKALTEPAAWKDVVTALQKSVAESDGDVARCFNPRHGMRVVNGKQTVDLVICFECLHLYAYLNGGQIEASVPLTRTAQPVFEKVLGAKAEK